MILVTAQFRNRPQTAAMADRTLTGLLYSREGIPTQGQCSGCGQTFTTIPDALADPEKATRDFYTAFAAHECLATSPTPRQRSLVILKYKGKVPILASCTVCRRKFFTAAPLLHDARGAEQYLLEKFDLHECPCDVASSSAERN